MEDGYSNEQLFEYTNIDPWFLSQFRGLHQVEEWLKTCKLDDLSFDDMYEVKRKGFSDAQLARFMGEHTDMMLFCTHPPMHTRSCVLCTRYSAFTSQCARLPVVSCNYGTSLLELAAARNVSCRALLPLGNQPDISQALLQMTAFSTREGSR